MQKVAQKNKNTSQNRGKIVAFCLFYAILSLDDIASGAIGREFESRRVHHSISTCKSFRFAYLRQFIHRPLVRFLLSLLFRPLTLIFECQTRLKVQ